MKIKVEKIIHITQWIRETHIGEIKIANVSLAHEHSVRNLVSRYNESHGIAAGKFIHVAYNNYGERMAIYGITWTQRKKELKKEIDESKWKKKLPSGFYSCEPWEEGSEHE